MITPPLGMRQPQQQQQQPNYVQGGPPQGAGSGMMKQMAMMGAKTALAGSPLAPVAGLLGGLFNTGGKVQHLNSGGPSLAEQINWGGKHDKKKKKGPARSWYDPRGWVGKNEGGMIGPLGNPHGYNEGGMAQETPIKKVMDEQKLEQQAMAFELEQKRKQEAHDMAMQQKQKQFAEAQKMKKAAATTSMAPKKPAGPLSSGKP